jgi:hypothetical protein
VNAVGKPDEGKPHVRFDVAGGGDQGIGRPVLQAPPPDPTSRRLRLSRRLRDVAKRTRSGERQAPRQARRG